MGLSVVRASSFCITPILYPLPLKILVILRSKSYLKYNIDTYCCNIFYYICENIYRYGRIEG